MEDYYVTLRDIRSLGYCSKGVREFYKRHDLDYSQLIKSGTHVDEIIATGDIQAMRVVEVVRGK